MAGLSVKNLVVMMRSDFHLDSCKDCTEIKLLCGIFETLEEKLTEDELKKIFVFPAEHFHCIDHLMGMTISQDVKSRFVANLEQKSIAAIVKCMHKYTSDACVQCACCVALYLATS
jgi:hypothetical protein